MAKAQHLRSLVLTLGRSLEFPGQLLIILEAYVHLHYRVTTDCVGVVLVHSPLRVAQDPDLSISPYPVFQGSESLAFVGSSLVLSSNYEVQRCPKCGVEMFFPRRTR